MNKAMLVVFGLKSWMIFRVDLIFTLCVTCVAVVSLLTSHDSSKSSVNVFSLSLCSFIFHISTIVRTKRASGLVKANFVYSFSEIQITIYS